MTEPLDRKLKELADAIVAEALQGATSLPDKVDAFKVVYPYYVALLKSKSKPDDEDEDTLGNMARRIAEGSNGGSTKLRGGSGRQ